MNSVRRKNLSLKYQRFTPSGEKNIDIKKSEFVTKTQFLWRINRGGSTLQLLVQTGQYEWMHIHYILHVVPARIKQLLEWDACTEHLIKLNRYLFSKKYEEGRISVYLNKDNELTFRVEVNPSGKEFCIFVCQVFHSSRNKTLCTKIIEKYRKKLYVGKFFNEILIH